MTCFCQLQTANSISTSLFSINQCCAEVVWLAQLLKAEYPQLSNAGDVHLAIDDGRLDKRSSSTVPWSASPSNNLTLRLVASKAWSRRGFCRAIAQTTAVPGACRFEETVGVVPPGVFGSRLGNGCGDWFGSEPIIAFASELPENR